MSALNRRQFVAAAALAAGTLPFAGRVRAAVPTISAITWGAPWIDGCKAITERQSAVEVNWRLHEGGSFNVVAKIAATWPETDLDLIHAWPPVTHRMTAEDWLEPITLEDIPNLAKIPEVLYGRNAEGAIMTVPISGTATFWAYDEASIGMKIEKPEDLFAPALKGKVLMTVPTHEVGRMLVSLALARGGDERNIEPGFEFAKELIKAGMVGRVAKSDTEVINSLASGEVAIGLVNMGNLAEIKKARPIVTLNKVADSTMFKTFVSHENFSVLKTTKNKKAVMDFINFFIEAQNNADYTAMIGHIPLNADSAVSPEVKPFKLDTAEDQKAFGYYGDLAYASEQLPEWNRKWELEVVPLLRG